jgi:hypothetical protein
VPFAIPHSYVLRLLCDYPIGVLVGSGSLSGKWWLRSGLSWCTKRSRTVESQRGVILGSEGKKERTKGIMGRSMG